MSTTNRISRELSIQHFDTLGLHINEPEPALICRNPSCKFVLRPSIHSIVGHLTKKHNVKKSNIGQLAALLHPLGLLGPSELALRPDGSPPHPHLAVRRGAECKHCGRRSMSVKELGRHLSKSHGMRRKASGWLRDEIRDGLALQSWDFNGARGYWIVAGSVDDGLHEKTSTPRLARLEDLHRAERQRMTSRLSTTTTTTTVVNDDMALNTNWMRRTGWTEIFAGEDRALLVALAALPHDAKQDLYLGLHGAVKLFSSREDEAKLMCMTAALDRAFDRCEDTVRHTHVSMRCWLRSHDPERAYKDPFELVGRRSTTVRYRRQMKRCVCFWMRFWRLLDGREPLFARSLSESQRKAIASVWNDDIWSTFPECGGDRLRQGRGEATDPETDDDDDDETSSAFSEAATESDYELEDETPERCMQDHKVL